ncbi:MAG: FAD-dependent monooxygenase, partial [Pseudonocardiaceae bacterium]
MPVLIVGAGPAGLTTAITLAHQGIGSLLIERRDDASDHPRATVISTRSMELFRSWGLESRIQVGSVDVTPAAWVTATLASAQGCVMPVGLPDRAQAAAISPTRPAWAPQDHLESVLLTHLRTHRGTRVQYRTGLSALDQDHDGVRATLHDQASGTVTTVGARFVVAADGAHSTVRNALGIPMHGPDRVRESLLALFVAPLWDVVGVRRYGIYLTGQAEAEGLFGIPATGQAKAEGVFIAAGGDRWMYGRDWEPGREQVTDYPAD